MYIKDVNKTEATMSAEKEKEIREIIEAALREVEMKLGFWGETNELTFRRDDYAKQLIKELKRGA